MDASHFANGRFLHHSFVCKLLNDLFGVQARAGCQCAGPYHMRLLGVPDAKAPKVKQQVLDDVGIMKPGSCRLSLTFFMSDAEVSRQHVRAGERSTFIPYTHVRIADTTLQLRKLTSHQVAVHMFVSVRNQHYAEASYAPAAAEAS